MDAQALADARIKLKLSQEGLARKLGLSARQIRRYENGETPIETWLELAVDSLRRDLKEMLPPDLVRRIRNATSVSDLAEIKAILGLSEPEVLFTHDELLGKVEELLEPRNGLYFDEDDNGAWGHDADENPTIPPAEVARKFADKWFEENLWTFRGRRLENRHFLKSELFDFFSRLIWLSHDEYPTTASDDSREEYLDVIEAWLDERFHPFTITSGQSN
jgi:transcriptional regulator with XRE-family HTH domain